jgi:hypothetical protein
MDDIGIGIGFILWHCLAFGFDESISIADFFPPNNNVFGGWVNMKKDRRA